MSFLDKRKEQLGVKSLGDKIKSGKIKTEINPNLFVHGPPEFDNLVDRWAKKEVMGLIGGSGAGKTECVMYFFKHILENSKNDDSIVIFVSLEMTDDRIAQRWTRLVGENSPLSDRFFVISNFDEQGKARELTTDTILAECEKIKQCLGVEVNAISIDHLHIIKLMQGQDLNRVCQKVKDIAVSMNSFLILLSQTTKGKSGSYNDNPLDKDSSFGCSQFTWIASWVMTIHQPLGRLKGTIDMNVLAWSYQKIREKKKKDGVQEGIYELTKYDIETGNISPLDRGEMALFKTYYNDVLEMRKQDEEEGDSGMYNTKIITKNN